VCASVAAVALLFNQQPPAPRPTLQPVRQQPEPPVGPSAPPTESPADSTPIAQPTQAPPVENPLAEPANTAPITAAQGNVPISVIQNDKSQGFSFEHVRLQLDVYSTSSYFTLTGWVTNQRRTEVEALSGAIELLDATDHVLQTLPLTLRSESDPRMRPRDQSPFSAISRSNSNVHHARLRLTGLMEGTAATHYEPSRSMSIRWETSRPRHVNLRARERKRQYDPGLDGDSGFLTLEIELTNTGETDVRGVDGRIEALDTQGRSLCKEDWMPFSDSDPSLRPGQTRIDEFICEVARRPGTITVTITELM
jgi:hypothetical protein